MEVRLTAEQLEELVASAVRRELRGSSPVAASEGACDHAALSDNSRATDGGSSATQEEPMYQKIYGPYLKAGKFHVHLWFLDGTMKYRTFGTEEEAKSFVRSNARRTIANPI